MSVAVESQRVADRYDHSGRTVVRENGEVRGVWPLEDGAGLTDVSLPLPGESVRFSDVYQRTHAGVFLHYIAPSEAGARPQVMILQSGRVETFMVKPHDVAAPVCVQALPLWRGDLSGVARHIVELGQQVQAKDARLERIVSDAHEWADDHDLCSVFDEFCETHDLPTRNKEYTVTVRVSASLQFTREARSEFDARNDVDTEDVMDALSRFDLTIEETSATEA